MNDTTMPSFDPSNFAVSPYVRRVDKPWGYELHWVPEDAPYMGKLLHIHANARLSLQAHDQKRESWFLLTGRAMLIWENERGELVETELKAGLGYTIQLGQKHRLEGITDCDIIEVSTPEVGTTWRLDDDYARPNQTPTERQAEYATHARVES